ncbi:hypothetical protein [Azospirillum soli]|uniref:hypothetical protein n=1 Tax=Azospirillum soli TaxID=1304799 RepID=UPI001AE21E01|nr:hypothetical protein [Azospirillum soli]MBP2316529.1 hypothetical protein [Azospirillum soli]
MSNHVPSPDTDRPVPAAPETTGDRLRALARLLGRMAARECRSGAGEATQPPSAE